MTFKAPNKEAGQNTNANANAQVNTPDANTQEQKSGGGLGSMLSRLSTTRVTSLGEGVYSKFVEQIEEITKNDSSADRIMFAHDSTADLKLPITVFYRKSGSVVYFYALMAEELLYSPLQVQEEFLKNQFGQTGKKIEIDCPVSKCWNDTYINTVKKFIAAKLSIDPANVKPVHFYAIPKTQTIVDPGMPERIYNTALQALKSKANPGEMVTSALFKEEGIEVTVATEICPGTNVLMADERVTAADAIVTVRASEKTKNNDDIHKSGESYLLASTAVKFETIFVRSQNIMPGMQNGFGQPVPQNHPLLVITNSCAYDGTSRQVIENPMTPILSVLSIGQLAAGVNWQSLFMPTAKKGPIARSLEALGYVYEPYQAAGAQFIPGRKNIEYGISPSQEGAITFQSFIASYFVHGSMSLAKDIGIGTRESWKEQMFIAAARRDPGANELLIKLMDTITDDKFSPLWAQVEDKEIIQSNVSIIHGGNYNLSGGEPSDIRWIDNLFAYDKMGEACADPAHPVHAFADSFVPGATTDGHGLERLDARRKDIEALEPTAIGKIDTLYVRVFFNPKFAAVAAAAMAQAQINMNPTGLTDHQANAQLAQGFVYGQSVDASVANNIFRPSFANPQGNNLAGHMPGQVYL